MKSKARLDDIWIKASVTGTIWAASEIVLGSFLHNLKVPFSGNFLTSIGIVILVAVSYNWKEKGLFWRAGLICALMKTMSPSAVIFGPMIAIFSEAMLLEISVRVLGKSAFGYILGSMLAMSWNLVQKIVNSIIFYGFNIVELYKNLIKFAQKQLDIQVDIVWLPILFLLVLYCVFGMISALAGMKIGRRIREQPAEYASTFILNKSKQEQSRIKQEFRYSFWWLGADVVILISALYMLNFAHWLYWGISTIAAVIIWVLRYKRALHQLLKPKFWIYFAAITMLTAFVFSNIQSFSFEKGLLIGLQMNFRASVVVIGFSVLGTELYNPKIRRFFIDSHYNQFPIALELSFETLPSVIAAMPEIKSLVKHPVDILGQIISQAEYRMREIKSKLNSGPKYFILSGPVASGKTTILIEVIESLKANGICISGIYSPRLLENNRTIGYDVVDIHTGKQEVFLRRTEIESMKDIGPYTIYEEGLNLGKNALKELDCADQRIVVIDEVGNLELSGKGWASCIEKLVNPAQSHLLLVVRENLVDSVIKKWDLTPAIVFNVTGTSPTEVTGKILKETGSI